MFPKRNLPDCPKFAKLRDLSETDCQDTQM